jgi:tetratricopeptide (TPR) repeat protein
MKPEQQTLIWLFFTIAIGIPIAVLAAAIVLRAACALCRVPSPSYWKSIKTVTVACIAGCIVGALPALFLLGGNVKNPQPVGIAGQCLISLFVLLVTTSVYATSLQLSFGKALLVRLTETGIILVISGLVGGAVLLGMISIDAFQTGKWTFKSSPPPQTAPPRDRKRVATNYSEAGNQAAHAGNIEVATETYRSALGLWKELASEAPAEPEFQREIAKIYFNSGEMLRRANRSRDAEAAYHDALSIWERLAAQDATESEAQEYVAQIHHSLSLLLANLSRNVEAEATCSKAIVIWQRLAADHPKEPRYRKSQARARNNLGVLLVKLGRTPEAEAAHRTALELCTQLLADSPSNSEYLEELVWSKNYLGGVLLKTGRSKEAEPLLKDALAVAEQLESRSNDKFEYARLLAVSHYHLGIGMADAGRLKDAGTNYARAGTQYSIERARSNPDFPGLRERREDLARRLCHVGAEFGRMNAPREVDQYYNQALRLWQNLVNDFPSVVEYRREQAKTNSALGEALSHSFESPWASIAGWRLNDAVGLYRKLVTEFPNEAVYRKELAETYIRKAEYELTQHSTTQETIAAYQMALDIIQKLAAQFPDEPAYRNELQAIQKKLDELGARKP